MKSFAKLCLIVCLSGFMTENAQAYNAKAQAVHPDTGELYIVSRDDGGLYRVNGLTGDLTPASAAAFAGTEYLSFHPDGTLWGWLNGRELIKINVQTGESEVIFDTATPLAGMAWNGDRLYGAVGAGLWRYDGLKAELACDLSPYTSSLEVLSKDTLLIERNGAKIQTDFNMLNQDTCELAVMPRPSISLEWEQRGITVFRETWHKTALSINLSVPGGRTEDYRVRFNRTVSPDDGIAVSSDYPAGGWSARESKTFVVNMAVYGGWSQRGHMITGTAVIENTGESYSEMLAVRVTVPDPEGELYIISPKFSPSAINLDVPAVEVIVRSSVRSTANPPGVLTLEEVDENGLPVRVLGELNDYGFNGDDTVDDFGYAGTFTVAGGAEGRKYYRAAAVFNGKRVASEVDFFTVTRFPIGLGPYAFDYLAEDPASGAFVFLDKLTMSFIEGVSPDRIEEIVAAENAVIFGTTTKLGLFHVTITSDGTFDLLWDTVAAFEAYPEIEFVDISVQYDL